VDGLAFFVDKVMENLAFSCRNSCCFRLCVYASILGSLFGGDGGMIDLIISAYVFGALVILASIVSYLRSSPFTLFWSC
jgi:Fe2+ transport system protein B